MKVLEVLTEKEESTGKKLAETYKERTGRKINPKRLAEILRYAEGDDLITKEIMYEDENPILLWNPFTTYNV